MGKKKFRSVVYMQHDQGSEVVLLPFAVSSARGRTFSGNDCHTCVVVDEQTWERDGITLLIDVLLRAPFTVDEAFPGLPTRPSRDVLGVRFSNAHMTTYDMEVRVKAWTWVRRDHQGTAIHGKISIFPSWTPYWERQVFAFMKLPPQQKFLSEFTRLCGPRAVVEVPGAW